MKNKIINLLQEHYYITPDVKNRVDQLLECLQDDNVFYTLDEIMEAYLSFPIEADAFIENIKKCHLK